MPINWAFRQGSIEQCRLICCGIWSILTVDKSYEQTERNSRVTVFFYAALDKGSFRSVSGLAICDERGEILVSKTVIHSDILQGKDSDHAYRERENQSLRQPS